MIIYHYPVPKASWIAQTYQQHVDRAKRNGWCYMPNPACPSSIYYYGGIDWGIPTGTPVWSTAKGKIVRTENQGTVGYGMDVRIEHEGGYLSIYAHLANYIVKIGDVVDAGTVVGYSDNTGNSTGPHLHFEMRKDGIPFDPMPFLTGEIIDPTIPGSLMVGEVVKLRRIWDYVNIRNGPGIWYMDCGDFKFGDIATVLEVNNRFLRIFTLPSGFGLWIHSDYVEKVT